MAIPQRIYVKLDGNHPVKWKASEAEGFEIGHLTPEQRMLLAMVERAVLDITTADLDGQQSAIHWFFVEDDPDLLRPFSFDWTADLIGIEPISFRKKLCARLAIDKRRNYNLRRVRESKEMPALVGLLGEYQDQFGGKSTPIQ